MSKHTVLAYESDLKKLIDYLSHFNISCSPKDIDVETLYGFIYRQANNQEARTQARMISGIRSFFSYLIYEDIREDDPSVLIEMPKIGQKLPEVMSTEEIDALLGQIDQNTILGIRNEAIIEMLYSCGLRVSELIHLELADVFLDEGFIRVTGKGNKQRLVPISPYALSKIKNYIKSHRIEFPTVKGHEDVVFLNRRGKKLTRVMIYTIVNQLADKAGLNKKISPHTFRHSFATHLLKNGADLRAIQQLLGHESINTTEIYVHLDRQFLKDVIEKHHPRK